MNICTTNEIMLISLEEARGEAERANSLVGRMGGEASAGRGRDAEHQHKLAPLRRTFDMSLFSAKADLPFTLRPNPFAAHLRFETTGEVP
jgi:hypothetical protein